MGSRLSRLLIVAALVAIPAAALRLACVGNACEEGKAEPAPEVPFCSLPGDVRTLIVDGYRNERSPELLAVTEQPAISGQVPDEPTGAAPLWPSLRSPGATEVPIVIVGAGIPSHEQDLGLDDVAPTIAKVAGIDWPHPSLRTGEPTQDSRAARARLAVMIAWKGIGTADLEGAEERVLTSLLRQGTGSMHGATGSLPVDSTASLTTAGAGTLPRVHGVTGTLLRTSSNDVAEAWGPNARYAVVNGLGDALDSTTGERAQIGAVFTDHFDQGLVGGTWFEGITDQPWITTPWTDDDDVRVVDPARVARTAETMLGSGAYGSDEIPDLFGVTLEGTPRSRVLATQQILAAARRAGGPGTVIAIFGTGSASGATAGLIPAGEVVDRLNTQAPIVAAAVPGGLFLDREAMGDAAVSSGNIAGRLKATPGMADVFPAFAITLERFC